jgi:hypothetical protein
MCFSNDVTNWERGRKEYRDVHVTKNQLIWIFKCHMHPSLTIGEKKEQSFSQQLLPKIYSWKDLDPKKERPISLFGLGSYSSII